jgi:serine-type D-Ala-D-Ala carboxypeptidase/endopeptidase (penicillin-binding protein 4)
MFTTFNKKSNIMKWLTQFFLFFSVIFFACSAYSKCPELSEKQQLVSNGGFLVMAGKEIQCSYKPEEKFVPASILKILTSLAAIKILGLNYRFKTKFYLNTDKDLFIEGKGDPSLTSEEIVLISSKLKNIITEVRNIYIDDSFFNGSSAEGSGSSLNPYDGLNGALVVNFNTINIQISKTGEVSSAEKQTPLIPLMKQYGKKLSSGKHRINISNIKGQPVRYAGELFEKIFKEQGISVLGKTKKKYIEPDCKLIYTHNSSKNLEQIIQLLLLYSNNFIANQLFLMCGVKNQPLPATWKKGQKKISDFLISLKILPGEITVNEGSGLSRLNKLSCLTMKKILDEFKPFARLLPKESSLMLKTGTLNGIYSYAGYLKRQGRLDSIIIILNQPVNNRKKLLKLLISEK